MYQFSKSKSGLEKENNIGKNIKRTVAGFLAGINMMVPGAGTAASEKPAPEEIKPPAGVSDVLIGETEKGELEKLEEMEVNRRFSEFLNGEGEYSDDNLRMNLFGRGATKDLGYESCGRGGGIDFQSVLLFHKNINGEEILALGIKDRSGKRNISLVSWPIRDMIKISPVSAVAISKTDRSSSWLKVEKYYNEEDVGLALDKKIGMVLKISMDSNPKDREGTDKIWESNYRLLFSGRTDVNQQFLSSIWRPPEKELSSRGKEFFKKTKRESVLTGVDSYGDFMETVNDNESELPFILGIYYHD